MKRREFIALLGGGVTWPLCMKNRAAAQQPNKVPRIGVLTLRPTRQARRSKPFVLACAKPSLNGRASPRHPDANSSKGAKHARDLKLSPFKPLCCRSSHFRRTIRPGLLPKNSRPSGTPLESLQSRWQAVTATRS